MIELKDIAYVRSGTSDIDTAVRFAVDVVGLELAAREGGTAYLRADTRHHCLAFVEGESGVLASAFSVADEDALGRAKSELEGAALTVTVGSPDECHQRRVRRFIAFDDPAGNHIELVVGHATAASPVHFSRPAGITEFGHLCIDAPDVHDAYRFWHGLFNARVSDWIGDAACLIRIDPMHHKMAVFKGDRPGLCHINFQVESIDDVMRSWHFLVEQGVEIEQGPGRHPQSTAVFLYFKGPEGLTYEYSWGVQRIEDEVGWRPRVFPPEEPGSIDMWGGPIRRVSSQLQILAAGTSHGTEEDPGTAGPAADPPEADRQARLATAPAIAGVSAGPGGSR